MVYDKNSKFDEKLDYRSAMPQFTAEAMDKNQQLFELLRRTAEEKSATPAQISLAWMICKKPWIVPIPGTRKLSRLKENLGAADVEMTSEEVRSIDEALNSMDMSAIFGVSK